MGLFSSSSKSASNTNTAADSSNVVTGTRAQYLESGAFANTGTVKSGTFSEAKISAATGGTVNIGETGVAQTFADTIKELFAAKSAAPAVVTVDAGGGADRSRAWDSPGVVFPNGSQGGGAAGILGKPWVWVVGVGLLVLGAGWWLLRRGRKG